MILVFIILGIIIFMYLTMFILILSNIRLEAKKIHISNVNEKRKLELKFILNISISFLNKINFLKFTIDNIKINNLLNSGKIDMQKFKLGEEINNEILKGLKESSFKIEYLKLDGYFATFDTVLTSSIFAILHAIIPILISRKINGRYINNIEFLNINENVINLGLNCIISIKMVNIINILRYLTKKGGNKNNGKSSYRRSYAYSNE